MTGTRVDSLPWLAFRWFAPLPTAKLPMAFLLYTALIRENHVGEVVVLELQGPLESLALVLLSNELAISAATKSPPESCSTTENGAQAQTVA